MDYIQNIMQLYNLSKDDMAGYKEEIITFEKEKNIILPKMLREYYVKLGKVDRVNDSFNHLLRLEELYLSADRYFIFYEENQSVVSWGIQESDLYREDPPIFASYDAESIQPEWFLDSDSLGDFLLTMACWNGVLGGLSYSANTENVITDKVLTMIETNRKELKNITRQYLRLFTNDYSEVIVFTTDVDTKVNGIFIGTEDEDRFLKMIDRIDIKWDYRSDKN